MAENKPFFQRKSVQTALAAVFLLLSIVYIGYGLTVYSSCDGLYRWQESACVLAGADPFAVAAGTVPSPGGVGPMHADGGNMPWTYLLSNVIYPGFLPYPHALVWARALFVLLLVVAVFRLSVYCKRTYGIFSPRGRVACVAVFFASYMWLATLRLGNHAAYLCLLLILLLTFDHDRYWWIAGVCYAFLLMKPQTTGLFLLYFLLKKRWKPVLLAGGILGSATVVTSVLIGSTPFAMLKNAYALCVSYENLDNYIYYGLLDPLVSVFHVPSAVVLPIGMALGVAAVFLLVFRLRTGDREVDFAALSLLSVCWMYIQPSDMIVLGFVGFASLTNLLYQDMRPVSRRTYALVISGALIGALPLLGRFYMAGPVLPLAVRLLYFAIVAAQISLCRARLERIQTVAPSPDSAA